MSTPASGEEDDEVRTLMRKLAQVKAAKKRQQEQALQELTMLSAQELTAALMDTFQGFQHAQTQKRRDTINSTLNKLEEHNEKERKEYKNWLKQHASCWNDFKKIRKEIATVVDAAIDCGDSMAAAAATLLDQQAAHASKTLHAQGTACQQAMERAQAESRIVSSAFAGVSM